MRSPEVCILKTDGINCDAEMAHAFNVSGGRAETVHVNQLRSGERRLNQYQVLALPGGFSYGDDIASGRILATELTSFLSEQLQGFVDDGKPVLGICNGFQVLVRTGLLPNRTLARQQVTLAENEVGRFECRWVNLAVARSVCKFANQEDFPEQPIPIQTAHGEGRFVASDEMINQLISQGQVVFRYASSDPSIPPTYPDNPNGAMHDIAGICDPSGLVLGMMPHPERSLTSFHPHRIKTHVAREAARVIFSNIVNYAKEM